ncbi:MAG: hypothetical protein ACKPKO_60645, partial [Candidatus Fonsibacter sp.]
VIKSEAQQPNKELTDSDGLSRAYAHGDYAIIGDTLYIAGTHTQRNVYDDITKGQSTLNDIPVLQHYRDLMWGLSKVPVFGGYAK